jgi:DNA polymerase-3 subunit gamma/tau
MSYLALARKYRPQNFDELIGQEFVSTSLKNAISMERVSHAYLFTGARGVGKTSAARILAKALNCLAPVNNNPCNECEHCLETTNGTAMDVIEIDGASNRGIDEIRQLREAVRFIPVKYKYKVYIIDEVHMLTEAAANALLKTLEEPPSYVVFIFATTDAHKIMPTILSRCQRYDFKRIPFDDMHAALEKIFHQEKVAYDINARNLIIRQSEGCMRDALSLCDQVISYTSGNVTYATVAQMMGMEEDSVIHEIYSAVMREDLSHLEELIGRLCNAGVSLPYAVEKMITHTRNLLLLSKGGGISLKLTTDETEYYNTLSKDTSEHRLFALFQLVQKLHTEIRYSAFARYAFEFGLYKAGSLSRIIPLPVAGGATTSTAPTPPPGGRDQGRGDLVATPPPADVGAGSARPAKPEEPEKMLLSTLEKRWNEILTALKGENPALSAVLQHSTLKEYSGERIVISFPKERKFHYDRATTQENLTAFKAFLQRKLGNITLDILNGDVDEKKKPLIDKKQELESLYDKKIKQESAEIPAVKRALELFDAKSDELKVIKK